MSLLVAPSVVQPGFLKWDREVWCDCSILGQLSQYLSIFCKKRDVCTLQNIGCTSSSSNSTKIH